MDTKKYKTILFTNARDEKDILEWIIHHLNLGFDHIYIYDHKSSIPLREILKNFPISPNREIIETIPVTLNRINTDITEMKKKLMDASVDLAKENKYDWMLYLDCDEFLILNHDDNINSFLSKYDEFNQVGINWLMFGSNFHNETKEGTVLERYTRSQDSLNFHIKTFIKPHECVYTLNPHVYRTKDMNKSVGTNKKILNKHMSYCFHNSDPISEVPAFIAHYAVQSYETYLQRKINLPRDDTGTFRDPIAKSNYHNYCNDIITLIPFDKYNKKNKDIMNKYV